MTLPFLLEIGLEEVPDWMIEPAVENLHLLFSQALMEYRLGGEVLSVDGTPRRLALRADGLLDRQPDEMKTALGPPLSAGPGAAQGFAKKMGVTVADLETSSSAKGEYYSYNKRTEGRATLEILPSIIPRIIEKIYFPKTMYWTGKDGLRFIRPIRWVVALLGEQIVPFEIAGVRSGNVSRGHRQLGASEISVGISNYEEELRKNHVILSAAQRRARIEERLGHDVRKDEALLNTLVYLTEFPTPIRGSFEVQYLELPREILTTVMRHHQKYFSVEDGKGGLAPEFVAVMNTGSDAEGLVRKGHERVLRARFNDARFFWEVDLRRRLEERIEDLEKVIFQAKLGSYKEKTLRVAGLAKELARKAGVNSGLAERAALLSKCDLTTDMVKEFTELQGIVGGLYAREQGESPQIWQAVYEQYKPVSMEDSIPGTPEGRVLALADKLDTLQGCFAIGLVPTGSKDPFALRRAAQGVVRIVVEGRLRLSLAELVQGNEQLSEFLLDRIRYYFKDIRGFRYDEVNAVLASGSDGLTDVEQRLEAIREVRPTDNFEPLAASFKRIQNILLQAQLAGNQSIDTTLLEEGPETELHAEFTGIRDQVEANRKSQNYKSALEAIASIRPFVDRFFDKVLVNAPDERIRRNRLTLLRSLLTEFSAIADFSEIVTSKSSEIG